MNSWIKALIKQGLSRFGFEIKRVPLDKPTDRPLVIHLWDNDDQFNELMEQIADFTLVDKIRCFMIYQYAKQAGNLPGDVAEVGVYKGGTARLLAKSFEAMGKHVHLFDTFSGMPPADPRIDLHREGDFCDTSLESVKAYLQDCKNVRFWQGVFPITSKPIENATFCFVHVDVDIYKSVMDCCRFFYPRLERGGIIIFDDYGFSSCPGAKKAVDEFFSDKKEKPCYLPTGQCTIIRP